MRAIPFAGSNTVFRLDGEGPERGVPAKVGKHAAPDGLLSPTDPCAALPYALTRWTLDNTERAVIASGGDIELVIFGGGFPPVSLGVASGDLSDMFAWAAFSPDTARDIVELIRLDGASAPADLRTAAQDARLERLAQTGDVLESALRRIEPPAKPPPPPPAKR
jgi:hypothetical protein